MEPSDIVSALDDGTHVPLPSDYLMEGTIKPKSPLGIDYSGGMMPQPSLSPSGIVTSILMLLGGGMRPGRGLPTGTKFPMSTQMPPGYGRSYINREPGSPGAMPEAGFIGLPPVGERLRGSGSPHEIMWRANDNYTGFADPGWQRIFRNMPDFPQSVPRNLQPTPQPTPPPGFTTQGMTRTRSYARNPNWDELAPQISNRIRTGESNLIQEANNLGLNARLLHQELTNRNLYTGQSYIGRREQVHTMMAEGRTNKEIADELGMHPANVAYHRNTFNQNAQTPEVIRSGPENPRVQRLLKILNTTGSYQRAGELIGMSGPAVYQFLRRNGAIPDRSRNRGTRQQTQPENISRFDQIPSNIDRDVAVSLAPQIREMEYRLMSNPGPRGTRRTSKEIAQMLNEHFNLPSGSITPQGVQTGRGWHRNLNIGNK